MVKESLEDVVLAKESSQPKSTYEAAITLTKFELKKILIDKMDKKSRILTASKQIESRPKSQKEDGDPSAGSDRGLKKRKTKKDAEPTKGPKAKESKYGSSKGTKYQPKSSGKSVQSEERELRLQIRTCHKIKRRTRNRITNLSGDDVSDFAIALRMFTRSLVIKKRVEDLQLGVESYQKKINAGNPVKEALIMSLLDHKSILTYSKGIYKDGRGVKELQERCIIKAFKLSYQEKYEHVGPKSQDHKMARLQDDVKRLCLVNDLKKFKDHIHIKSKIQVKA
ncbi:hypothetical protein Tco_0688145 [Tanacetum coccineum]